MEVHDEVPGLGVSIPHLAFVAVGIVAHLVLLEGQVRALVPRLRGHGHLVAVGAGEGAGEGAGQGAGQGHRRGGHVVVEGAAVVVVVQAGAGRHGHAGGARVVFARPAWRRLSAHIAVIILTLVFLEVARQRLEHGKVRVAVHAEPVLGVVDVDQVSDQLLVGLADQAALTLVRPEHHVVVQRVVDHRETQELEVDPDLVHAARVRLAQDDARVGPLVEAELLEGGGALLAPRGHLAHADLVRDHLDGLRAGNLLVREVALHAADVLLGHLPVPDLVLHLARLLG